MFVTGPNVIKTVTNEDVTFEDLGGAMSHNMKSGVAHFAVDDDEACIAAIRRLLSFLPQNNVDDPPIRPTKDAPDRMEARLDEIVPPEPNKPYDMKEIVRLVVDEGDFFEVHEHFARTSWSASLASTAARRRRREPARRARRVLDIKSSTKAARFVRFCDAFNIPLVRVRGPPGFLPGTEQEWGGIIRGAKLLYAYCGACPQADGRRAKGVRRRLRRHVLEAHPGRLQRGVAAGGAGRDGGRRRREHHLPEGAGRREGRRQGPRRSSSRSTTRSSRTLRGRRARLPRRRDRAARDAAAADRALPHARAQAPVPPREEARQHPL